jgi:hypothetical protein
MTTADFPGSSGTTYSGGSDQGGAQEKAQQVAGTAADEGRHVASTAREEAQNVAAEARSQARNLMSEATSQLDDQSRTQKERLAGTMRTFGDDLEQMASGQSGLASEIARQVADRARTMSSHLEGREPRELLDEVRDFARRRPGTFLLGALAAGVVAGRLTRGAQAAQTDTGSESDASAGMVGAGTLGTGTTTTTTGTTATTPVAAPATTHGDALTEGAPLPSSGPGSAGLDEPGTATGDPLAGVRAEDVDTPQPAATPDPDAPAWPDSGSRP